MHMCNWLARTGRIAVLAVLLSGPSGGLSAHPEKAVDPGTVERFEHLSANGNSNCSADFTNSISTMPTTARLQGSCCSPMVLDRYVEQIEGLKKFAAFTEIPANPYDVEANLAQQAMASYDLALTPEEQEAYDYAMANAHEKGPCCCPCWRWQVYGGLAKLLIHEHGFSGEQIAEVWDLSDGCGGDHDDPA